MYVHSMHSYCWSSFLLGNKPPGMVPLKGQYMGKDISRLAHYYQIPLNAPAVSVAMTQPNLQHCLSLQSGNRSIFSSSVILLTSNLWNARVCTYILLVFYYSAFINLGPKILWTFTSLLYAQWLFHWQHINILSGQIWFARHT